MKLTTTGNVKREAQFVWVVPFSDSDIEPSFHTVISEKTNGDQAVFGNKEGRSFYFGQRRTSNNDIGQRNVGNRNQLSVEQFAVTATGGASKP